MSWKTKLIWDLYAAFYAFTIIPKSCLFFTEGSQHHLYFLILREFDPLFLFDYFTNAAQLLLNIINLLPVIFFIYQLKVFSPRFWQYLLILRLIFDIAGHSFELNQLAAIPYSSMLIAVVVYLQTFFFSLPSYAACYCYAFKQYDMAGKTSN